MKIFFGSTYKIIPPLFRRYKIFIISGLTKSDKKPKIFSMILAKFTDNISYSNIFNYLNINYGFKPRIILGDLEKSLTLAIKEYNKIVKI